MCNLWKVTSHPVRLTCFAAFSYWMNSIQLSCCLFFKAQNSNTMVSLLWTFSNMAVKTNECYIYDTAGPVDVSHGIDMASGATRIHTPHYRWAIISTSPCSTGQCKRRAFRIFWGYASFLSAWAKIGLKVTCGETGQFCPGEGRLICKRATVFWSAGLVINTQFHHRNVLSQLDMGGRSDPFRFLELAVVTSRTIWVA